MSSEIKLFNQDCMAAMKEMPDKAFDLAIVDPPYGIGVNKMTLGGGKYKTEKKWDDDVPNKEYFSELERVSKNHIIWGANHIGGMNPSSCWIVWDKRNGTSDFADAELAFTTFDSPVRIFRFHLSQQTEKEIKLRTHPTQKPEALYRWILHNYAKPNDKILDTHLGSGSIAIACYDMGFDLTGFEIDKEYFDAAVKRLDNHKKQLTIF